MAKNKDTIMEENIKNYSKQIKTMGSFVEAVRHNYGMYIGYNGNRGFINMIREVFQNSIDELMKVDSPCNEIALSYDERNHTTIVEDNGRGIPFNDMIRIFSSQHTSSNYIKKPGEFSSGMHGVGAKVTNALCDSFIVESYILGEARRVEFLDGKPGDIKIIPNKENKQGTMVIFHPSYSVMGNITTSVDDVFNLVSLISPLTNNGSIIHFNGIKIDGSPLQLDVVNTDGILTHLQNITQGSLINKPIYAFDLDPQGRMKAEIAFTYDSTDMDSEVIMSFSNFCPTTGGEHVKGFIEGVQKFFRDYMNKIYLPKNSKLNIVNSDIKSGLRAVVNVAHLEPSFTGQAKEILGNEDMLPYVKDVTINALNEWSKSSSNDLQKICKYIKDIAEIRTKSEEGKVKLKNNYTSSVLTGLPRKYKAPTGKEDLELIIVEGDSAAGSINTYRDHKHQGVFPIRGKIPNAFTTPKVKFLSNEEISGIISIIGAGYGKSFDINKVKFSKIIIGADADADGGHIRALVIRFFILYMPGLIESGKVYSIVPPLYSIRIGKNKYKYFVDRLDFIKYSQKEFYNNNKIETLTGNKITSNELTDLLYKNAEYSYELKVISDRYAVNPNLLELLLIYRNSSVNEIKKIVKKKYRFVDVSTESGTILVEGLADDLYQKVFFNNKIINDASTIINYINSNLNLFFMVNGEKMSLYDLMSLFENTTPKELSRYKGLGEMPATQLMESTILPNSNRTLIRYTIENAKESIESIRYFESNKNELIKNIKATKAEILG